MSRYFEGTLVSYDGTYYHCVYDDGDDENMDEREAERFHKVWNSFHQSERSNTTVVDSDSDFEPDSSKEKAHEDTQGEKHRGMDVQNQDEEETEKDTQEEQQQGMGVQNQDEQEKNKDHGDAHEKDHEDTQEMDEGQGILRKEEHVDVQDMDRSDDGFAGNIK